MNLKFKMLLFTFAIFSNFVNQSVSQSEAPVSIQMLLPRKPIVPCRPSFLRTARNPGPVRRVASRTSDCCKWNSNF